MTAHTPIRAIAVERDAEGLEQAIRTLFEESLAMDRVASFLTRADEATRDRVLDDMPERALSPGYFTRAGYLLDLSASLELGIPLEASSFTQADIIGLKAVRCARAEFEREHPACPRCGKRQDNAHLKQCFSCAQPFAGRGN